MVAAFKGSDPKKKEEKNLWVVWGNTQLWIQECESEEKGVAKKKEKKKGLHARQGKKPPLRKPE